jgi:O-antigen/teichoic acid export membrane protein
MTTRLKLRTFENIGYSAFARAVTFAFQAVSYMVLARNLTADDYGVLGFATIFITFLAQFSDLGISSAVIQRVELDESALYTGFTIKAILGVVAFAISFLLAPLSKLFFDSSAVANVLRVLSLGFILNTFGFLPTALLTRELNYKKLFVPQVVASVVSSIVCIALALTGFKYWSIVVAAVCTNIASAVLINVLRPVKLRFCFDSKAASQLIQFGGNLFLSGVIVFAIFNADNFIIGTVKGSSLLGYYALAFNWGSMTSVVVSTTVLSVFFPTFSRMQEDRKRIKSAYIKVLEYVAFIGLLANVGLLLVSKEFLIFVLGHGTDKWIPALTAFRILCIYGIFRCLLEPVGNVITAIGKTRELLITQIIMAVLQLGLLYPSLKYFGIEGVAVVVTVSYLTAYPILYWLLKQEIGLTSLEWIKGVYPAMVSLSVSTIVLYFIDFAIPFSLIGMIQKLILCSIIYCGVYGVITQWKMFHELKGIARDMVHIYEGTN